MKRYCLIAVYFFLKYIGIIRFFYWINRKKKIILTYHNVLPDELFDDSVHLGVSHKISVFKAHIKLIKKRFAQDKYLLTFDDGYKNQQEIAAEILSEQDMRGLFFITFQSFVTGETLTIDKIMKWVSYVPEGEYVVFEKVLHVKNDNRLHIASMLYQCLLDKVERWDNVENQLNQVFAFDLLEINPELIRLRFKPCNKNDIDLLIKKGHVVGAHSWSHRPLSSLTLEQQKNDFRQCKEFADKICNSNFYSYPYGSELEVSPVTVNLCKASGYSEAYMNIAGIPPWDGVDSRYIIPRISLPNEKNYYILEAKLSGLESFCKSLRRPGKLIVDIFLKLHKGYKYAQRVLSQVVNRMV